MKLTPEQQAKQEHYRDARFTDKYDDIWQSVGKCVFCDLRDKYIFFEEHGVVMTVSLFAYIDGHFMIVPRRHIRSTKELTQLEWDTVRKFTYIAKKLIRDVHGVKGMQIVQKDGSNAQSTVDQHLHFHCIPFDAPDLSVWNYRKLKYTPLENVTLYRQARKKIIRADSKFEEEYRQPTSLPIVCDAVLINEKQEVLLQKRVPGATLVPPSDTLPGGRVDDYSLPFEIELAREIREETGLIIEPEGLQLLASRIDRIAYARTSPHLQAHYQEPLQFVCNTYLATGVDSGAMLQPGDDAESLYWQPLKQAVEAKAISEGIRGVLKKALQQL
jgi:diadenosine tetraphosphate (Ap4A) HIT family hydrolase/8-oxo-dGTP pyrophosphatase MutT (NUDIX family)